MSDSKISNIAKRLSKSEEETRNLLNKFPAQVRITLMNRCNVETIVWVMANTVMKEAP